MAGGFKYKGANVKQSMEDGSSKYNNMLKEYDSYIGEKQKEAAAWRTIAISSLAIFIPCTLLGWYFAVNSPKAYPMVVEVAPWGEAKYVGNISTALSSVTRPENSVKYALRKFVENTRTVSTDIQVLYANIDNAYAYLTPQAMKILTEEISSRKINTLVGQVRITTSIETTLPITGNTWQVDWIETSFAMDGSKQGDIRYRGLFTLKYLDPTEDVSKLNPLGIFIDNYTRSTIDSGQE